MSEAIGHGADRRKATQAAGANEGRLERLKPWISAVVVCGVALASLAFTCEVYRSMDESNFDLRNCIDAVAAALRSLGPAR